MVKCLVDGCEAEATMQIIVNAADGDGAWWSCWEHTLEFEQWAREEVERQHGDLAEVFLWTRGERSP